MRSPPFLIHRDLVAAVATEQREMHRYGERLLNFNQLRP